MIKFLGSLTIILSFIVIIVFILVGMIFLITIMMEELGWSVKGIMDKVKNVLFKNKEEELKYELGRYQRAVVVRDKQIEGLKKELAENMQGLKQIEDICGAYIMLLGGDKEVTIKKEELTSLIGKHYIDIKSNEEEGTYTLCVKEIKKAVDEFTAMQEAEEKTEKEEK